MGISERRHRYSPASVNVTRLVYLEKAQGLTRSQSWTADIHMVAGTLTVYGEAAVAVTDEEKNVFLIFNKAWKTFVK